MKTLIMVRHAKSSWDDISMKDIDRPLNHRGKKDAPEMAHRLLKKGIIPDIFLSSPAARAMKTAHFFLKQFDKKDTELQVALRLYEASVINFYITIEDISNEHQTAIIFSHNPGITEFINDFGTVPVYNMPACGMYAIRIFCEDWKEIRFSNKEFLFFDYPKNDC